MTINHKDLVAAVAAHSGLDVDQTGLALRSFTEVVTTAMAQGEQVTVAGLAKFDAVDRPARTGRNPGTGETINIPASTKPRITPLKALKDAVSAGSRS